MTKRDNLAGDVRLGCIECDRNDFDGVGDVPLDWIDVEEVQSIEDALQVSPSDQGSSLFGWETHLGLCPTCNARQKDAENAM